MFKVFFPFLFVSLLSCNVEGTKYYLLRSDIGNLKYAFEISKDGDYKFFSYYSNYGVLTSNGKVQESEKSNRYGLMSDVDDTLKPMINKIKGDLCNGVHSDSCIMIYTNLLVDNKDYFTSNEKFTSDNFLSINDTLIYINLGKDTVVFCEELNEIGLLIYDATYFSKFQNFQLTKGCISVDFTFEEQFFKTHFFNTERDYIIFRNDKLILNYARREYELEKVNQTEYLEYITVD